MGAAVRSALRRDRHFEPVDPLARRATTHLVVAPTRKAADRLAAVLSAAGFGAESLTIRAAEGAAALDDLPAGSADIVVLSCAPAFPAYFAWCHEALRWLRVGFGVCRFRLRHLR